MEDEVEGAVVNFAQGRGGDAEVRHFLPRIARMVADAGQFHRAGPERGHRGHGGKATGKSGFSPVNREGAYPIFCYGDPG